MGRPSFVEQLNRMSDTALRKVLEEQYGLKTEMTATADQMRETILRLKEEAREKARKTNEKSLKSPFFAGEPIVKVLFQHKDGDRELKFNYDGGKGAQTDGKGRWKDKLPFFHLIDGEEYELPLSIVEFLNSRLVPDVRPIHGPGGQITNESFMRKRFSCEVIGLREALEKQKQIAEPATV